MEFHSGIQDDCTQTLVAWRQTLIQSESLALRDYTDICTFPPKEHISASWHELAVLCVKFREASGILLAKGSHKLEVGGLNLAHQI